MPRQTKEEKARDHLIEQTYYRHGSGVQINVMDIGKVFEMGRAAMNAGQDLDQAIKDAIAKFRQN